MQEKISRIIREMRRHVGEKAVVWHEEPFRVLIATVLSQRTKDQNTRRAANMLFSTYKTPLEIANAPLEELERLIRPSGFYKVKAERIKKISRQIVDNFRGKVPRDREKLLTLEGVGPKTAGCVQVYGFGGDSLPVDVHVFRISNRLGLVKTKTPEKTELELKKVIPKKLWKEINHLMVRYGQNVCLPRNPRCVMCGLREICEYYKNDKNVVRSK